MRLLPLALLGATLLTSVSAAAQDNTLTPAEKKAGWTLLFDGKTFRNWVDPTKKTPPSDAWSIVDGCLKSTPHAAFREDLKTQETFRDFELQWDWKLAPGANSGVKYRIQEVLLIEPSKMPKGLPFEQQVEYEHEHHLGNRAALTKGARYEEYPVAFEYQMIDNSHPDVVAHGPKYRAGALYSMVAPSETAEHPAGQWNHSRLVVKGKHVEHWLNGKKVVDVSLDSPVIAESAAKRWHNAPSILKLLTEQPVADSPIALQHHVDEAWFKNIKVKRLD